MGMFDDIKYEGRSFQTKDLDCEMDSYFIEGGRLFLSCWKRVDLPESEWRRNDLFPEIIHKTKTVPDGVKDMNFHGFLNFYTNNDTNGTPGEWEEYNAKFTDGNLVEIKRVEETP